jgi:hypothetical protein
MEFSPLHLFAQYGWARLFFHLGFLWIQFLAPSIELTPRHSQPLCECHDVFASS